MLVCCYIQLELDFIIKYIKYMEKESSKDGVKVYEVGFHIAPFVGEENIAHEVSLIKNALDAIKAEVISEDFPRLRALSYPITKVIKGDKKICNEAYFGWVKFEADSSMIDGLKKDIEKIENIIRFILVGTVKENTLYGAKFVQDKEAKREKAEASKLEVKEEINEVELDKSIDNLVV